MDIETTCCFTGHRPNKLHGYDPKTEGNQKMLWKLRDEIVNHIETYNVETFISGMALGIDMWAARIVLKLKEIYPSIKLSQQFHVKIKLINGQRKAKKNGIILLRNVMMFITYLKKNILHGVCKREMNGW
ncbi:hypothetical protein CHH83_02230 [Bacillus sp. 7586-K]|nr:hypothetical protein CHH83_02230 [Bacillus sp. 7586-K]